jgi:hypothetical protein
MNYIHYTQKIPITPEDFDFAASCLWSGSMAGDPGSCKNYIYKMGLLYDGRIAAFNGHINTKTVRELFYEDIAPSN